MAARGKDIIGKVAEAVAAAYPAGALKRVEVSSRANGGCAESAAVRRMLSRIGLGKEKKAASTRTLREVVGRLDALLGESREMAERALAIYAEGDSELGLEGVCVEAPRCGICALSSECRFRKGKITMHDIPEDERPRERLLKEGAEALSNAELLAIILRSGSTQETAVQLGERLLAAFGSLSALSRATPGELCSVTGVGPAKAAEVLAALNISKRVWAEGTVQREKLSCSRSAYEFLRSRLDGCKQETFVAVLVDTKNTPMKYVVISQGLLTESLVHPREAFRPALRESAAAVIFGHNHPSGDPKPSKEDLSITKRLMEAGELLGIKVLDHIVVGADSYYSMADHGNLAG